LIGVTCKDSGRSSYRMW